MQIKSGIHKKLPTILSGTTVHLKWGGKTHRITYSMKNNEMYFSATLYCDNNPLLSLGIWENPIRGDS